MTVPLETAELLATVAAQSMHVSGSQTPSESGGPSHRLVRIIPILQLRELVVSEVR